MKLPSTLALWSTLDATWPSAEKTSHGPWVIRRGAGGGKRVSAATCQKPVDRDDIEQAEAVMRDLGQDALFMIRQEDHALDGLLETQGYEIVDPVTLYLGAAADLAKPLPITTAIPSWPPLAIQCDLWRLGGLDQPRIDVMIRAAAPKVTILGRDDDTPCGTVFVAAESDIAMVHALETHADYRRKGVARNLMHAAGNWAVSQNLNWMTLAVTKANQPANALYRSMGMQPAASYHYRLKAPT